MEAQMNDEADYLVSSTQNTFRDLPEIPAPTFHMNEFTYHHVNDGWIESNIPQYVNAHMNHDSEYRL